MMKPICKEVSYWHGRKYLSELFDSTNFDKLSPVTQVKAVCFSKESCILSVIRNGEFVFPGGGIEDGETYEETLRRELMEEASLVLVDYGPSCYLRITNLEDKNDVNYHLRYWANVELIDKKVEDPDGKSIDRKVFHVKDFNKYIKDEKRRRIFEISLNLFTKGKGKLAI